MAKLDEIVHDVRSECAAEFQRRVRARLLAQPTEWLVDQLLAHLAPEEPGTSKEVRSTDAERAALADRIRALRLDETRLRAFVQRSKTFTRERLETEGYLVQPAEKGTTLIGDESRSPRGNALLCEARDMLHALLFGDAEDGVRLARVHRELLTMAVPCAKAWALTPLLEASTQIRAEGTWHDPEHVSNDACASNTIIEVEYGETASEMVGHGIAAALRLINDLEINEQILYARMENVEESTLV